MSEAEACTAAPFLTLLTEQEVAARLRVKSATIRAERLRGKLGYTRVGARIFYTPEQIAEQIAEYLERQSVPACADNPTSTSAKSAAIGSARSRDETAPRTRGAAPGTTTAHDRLAVSALAQQTFRRQPSASQRGSLRTSEPEKPRPTKS